MGWRQAIGQLVGGADLIGTGTHFASRLTYYHTRYKLLLVFGEEKSWMPVLLSCVENEREWEKLSLLGW